MNQQQKLDQLFDKLKILLQRQDVFAREIDTLRKEIEHFRQTETGTHQEKEVDTHHGTVQEPTTVSFTDTPPTPVQDPALVPPVRSKRKSDLEKFIGENLINKIGIIITILGAGIGAKYAIDHELISPLMRIVLGYVLGLGLLGFAVRLRKNYTNFSAVLLSGAMAIFYFITYAAFSFYALISQPVAFGMMVVFTLATVGAALQYNRQVIALIGLVGAYAVPFLLSPEEGSAVVLFSYVAIINSGILVIAFRKVWKALYYMAFGLTWLIYFTWFLFDYSPEDGLVAGMAFAAVYFAIFYTIFLAYKLINKERFGWVDILVLLMNSFLLYGFGYTLIENAPGGEYWLGLFTFGNALVHAGVSILVFRQKLAKRDLFYFISGLYLVFVTIAIPVEFNGHWVTLLWAGEAILLFWIGRSQQEAAYEWLGYPLLLIAFISLANDWFTAYGTYEVGSPESRIPLLFSVQFLTSLLCIASFGGINYLLFSGKFPSPLLSQTREKWFLRGLAELLSLFVPVILVFTVYGTFMVELETFWNQRFVDSMRTVMLPGEDTSSVLYNSDLNRFKTIWELNYSVLFFAILTYVNIRFIRSRGFGVIMLLVNVFTVIVFLTLGLSELRGLGARFIAQEHADIYPAGAYHIMIRYLSYLFLATLLVSGYRYSRDTLNTLNLGSFWDLFLHIVVLWIASTELILWLNQTGFTHSDKLGLSILWGCYALLLIVLGIWKQKRYLRVSAIVLFGATLIKLFFYDLTQLDTISKTIVFVSLGVLLLIISFLYQKYRKVI